MIEPNITMEIARGDALRDSGDLDAAIKVYRGCIAAFPEQALGHYKLGTAYMRLDRGEEAEACFRQSLSMAPDHAESSNNLGILLIGRREYAEAEGIYRNVLADKTDFPEAHLNLGDVLYVTRRVHEAIYHYRRCIALRPDWGSAWMQLGQALLDLGRSNEAQVASQRAADLDQSLANAWTNIGRCHLMHGNPGVARQLFERSLGIDPGVIATWHNWLLAGSYLDISREKEFECHASFGDYMAQAYPAVAYPTMSNTRDPLRKLRVGFVSGDLRRHSVSYFVEGLLRHLDRNLIETWVFYTYPGEDYRSAELKPFAHKWIPVHGTTDAHFAQHIRQSGIDILFDLSGHTGHGRLAVFALKAAPIQISWIGYPNTSGLKTMDYRISDAIADPPGIADNYCSETLLRLPGCFLCYTPPAEAPEVKEPPHLASQRIAFGSFNAVSKIGDATLSLWSRVLAAIPDSILVLKAADAFNTEERRERLLTRLSEVGVAPERVRLLPWERDVGKHLATYGEIDIALDTVPYNGTTTTCEALWMGVPVVSLTGDRHAARVGTSLLCAAGLEELVAANADQFVKICTELASDSDRLTRLRSGMRKRLLASPLCDEPGMATRLERALREVWQDWCARQGTGLAAEGGDLAADTTSTQYHDTETTLRIHLGGKEQKSGWKILNVQPGPNVDLVGDVRDLSAFADDSVAEVYASHVLEHVGQAEFLQTLKGIHRILAPGARLYISVPDMDILCRDFVDPKFDRAQRYHLMRILFGGQSDPFDFHQIGLNLDFMADFLQQAGFYSVEQVESFGLFDDASNVAPFGTPISLNLIAVK